eukprot:22735-Chlamydomonas_euryale.AAC.1
MLVQACQPLVPVDGFHVAAVTGGGWGWDAAGSRHKLTALCSVPAVFMPSARIASCRCDSTSSWLTGWLTDRPVGHPTSWAALCVQPPSLCLQPPSLCVTKPPGLVRPCPRWHECTNDCAQDCLCHASYGCCDDMPALLACCKDAGQG